ncbi:MAG: VPGUxxT family thioredoxin-like (seleno)protein, type 2 [Saprospiraceae bacterium]
MKLKIVFVAIYLIFLGNLQGQISTYPKDNPVELGKVNWYRDYDKAVSASQKQRLPILILFQEVPGCDNCTTFGNDILSHPLIVEAIETCFIPLCIHNNKDGHDRKILQKFKEPEWNNPVIRVVDANGHDIVPRQPDFRSKSKTLTSMIRAITSQGSEVPGYLTLLKEEVEAKESGHISEAYFSMYCFWSGEKEIAAIDGVIGTEAGYMHGKEVVKIKFRDDQNTLDNIFEKSQKVKCGDEIYASVQSNTTTKIKPIGKYRKDAEDKYYLLHSPYKSIPMTELQKTKVNRAIAIGADADIYLSPRQLAILSSKKDLANNVSKSIEDVWWVR